jgi:hypothetical protein
VTKEPNDLGDVKVRLMEKGYVEVVEKRAINSGCEDFQVLAHTIEPKLGESGEDRPGRWRYRSVSSLGVRCPGFEIDGKIFELWQGRQASGHCHRRDISRFRYIPKIKCREIACRREESWQRRK